MPIQFNSNQKLTTDNHVQFNLLFMKKRKPPSNGVLIDSFILQRKTINVLLYVKKTNILEGSLSFVQFNTI